MTVKDLDCKLRMENRLNIVVFLPKLWGKYVRWPHIVAIPKYANVFAVVQKRVMRAKENS